MPMPCAWAARPCWLRLCRRAGTPPTSCSSYSGEGPAPVGHSDAVLGIVVQMIDHELGCQDADVAPLGCAYGHSFGPNRVLAGWLPCRCGGHQSWECVFVTPEGWQCADVTYNPPRSDDCTDIAIR